MRDGQKLWMCERHRPPPVKHRITRFRLSLATLLMATIIYIASCYLVIQARNATLNDPLLGKTYVSDELFFASPLGGLFIGVGMVLVALWSISIYLWKFRKIAKSRSSHLKIKAMVLVLFSLLAGLTFQVKLAVASTSMHAC